MNENKVSIKNRAIFLDRDGLINDNSIAYYIHNIHDFKINPGVIESLKAFYTKGYLLIIVTNQGGVAKGQYTIQDIEVLNEYLRKVLENEGIILQDIYFCPHHSSVSKCLCRKPESLLFEKALAKYTIDPDLSFMIGDSDRDIAASEKAGIKGIKVPSNANLLESLRHTELSGLLD
jgi:D-glycero-D-manno-heptose 1,7-bisphosphate phosphatase